MFNKMFDFGTFEELVSLADFGSKEHNSRGALYPSNLFVEKDGTNVIQFALAGFSKEDLDVNVQGQCLTISVSAANKRLIPEGSAIKTHGIAWRPMKSSWILPSGKGLDSENISVSFVDGLLTIRVPVVSSQKRTITIN